MPRERTDLDIPEGTVWPASERDAGSGEAAPERGTPKRDAPEGTAPGGEQPLSLDPDRDTAERNAASGGWDGANEQIENDFEVEQLRRSQPDADEDVPLT